MNKTIKQGASSSLAPYYVYHPKCYCRLCLKIRKKNKPQATSHKLKASSIGRALVIILDMLTIRLYKIVKERIKNHEYKRS
jgi:hypothetical protein